MIDPDKFSKAVKKNIKLVVGVPDSLLKYVCHSLKSKFKKNYIISNNEGSSIAFAIGHYLCTNLPALIYMQNSGIGNAINPLVSLAHKKVYGIPMVLLIGWRGELKKNIQLADEPQHLTQGKITLEQLKLLQIPYKILNSKEKKIDTLIKNLKNQALKIKGPVALIVRKNTFSKVNLKNEIENNRYLLRENIIEIILKNIPKNSIIVCTTGLASRELYELRKKNNLNICSDFLTVGGMGHSSQIAAGIAFSSKKKIVCIDGDGSILMHLGSIINSSKQSNLTHILINNNVHDSVGGQTTNSSAIDFSKVAKELGYKICKRVYKEDDINNEVNKLVRKNVSSFIEIKSNPGYKLGIGRPKETLSYRKKNFMKLI